MELSNLLKTLGPGILFASTAIGVSHLVQSTQAGANFGFTLIFAVILANLFKYPFFEFGSRYANATGKSIISGYRNLGIWALVIYCVINVLSMFLVTYAVGYVTSSFLQNLFGISSAMLTVGIVFVVCIAVLISDNFKLLDGLIKVIGIVLLVSTLIAFFIALAKGPQGSAPLMSFEDIDKDAYLLFLIPLMGWMPTAVDLSTWNSLWTVERIKQTGYHPKLKETLFDFNLGYIISALLAICFLTLGAFIMFGTGKTFSPSGAKFSGEVIALYTSTFGKWAYIVIAVSAFSIMFGTCVAVFDGYSRAMTSTIRLLQGKEEHSAKNENSVRIQYRLVLILISMGSFCLIWIFNDDPDGFKSLVNLATSVSFIIAPVIAIFNFILVGKKHVGEKFVPPIWIRITAWLGIIFLSAFTIFFIFK
ncbi:MAG: divalent metal cation transporter, partial [Crocinitomicaceae bacterium]|nr:divalent metal cation transporter [Crocinitomicaceae bacterium]